MYKIIVNKEGGGRKNKGSKIGSRKEGSSWTHIKEEIADVLFFVLRFAQMNDLNLDDCITEKLQKNSSEKCV
ncbi:MAG: hypothetical protein IKL51_07430 [Lachnospiraceae bacterium]|nr:hypothetical protein [Lachnospiraceae bacterium]